MTYPRTVKLFEPWAKAMVAGATVDKPDYGKKSSTSQSRTRSQGKTKRRRRRRRSKRAKKEA